ncbi:hypothetical protein QTP70_032840 [Hemibagrus guttatus]|uniref:Uncharacterized protein n=1 Tax=Hemibagrus guttatus TaxID=175788 RepID=A0AAE0UNJ8_9TELE|nr:hypothetical protein QTP70_032840 [Hemibagrus guttatus]
MASRGETPLLSLRHGFRCVPEESVMVEDVLIALGEKVGFENIISASRMNRAIVVFLKEQRLVSELAVNGLVVKDMYRFRHCLPPPPKSPSLIVHLFSLMKRWSVSLKSRVLLKRFLWAVNILLYNMLNRSGDKCSCFWNGQKTRWRHHDTMEENREPVVNQEGTTEHVEVRLDTVLLRVKWECHRRLLLRA